MMDEIRRDVSWLITLLKSRRGAVVISGGNGTGKTILSLQTVEEIMRDGRFCIYVLTTMSPQSLVETGSSISLDLSEPIESGKMVIVDCYSRFTGATSLAKYVLGPEASLLQLRETILTSAMGSGGYHLVIDDLSTLLAYTASETAFKFYQAIVSDIRRNSASATAILVPDILETKLTNLLYSLSDGVVDMSLEEMGGALRRFIRIRFLRGVHHPTEWFEYVIGPRGIELISE